MKVRSKGIWISEGLLHMNNKMRTKHWGPGPHKSGPSNMIKENGACVSVLSLVFTSEVTSDKRLQVGSPTGEHLLVGTYLKTDFESMNG